jgi:NAD(P)-dependent dehydrogenase (short-subunit alcohol dehydrogenase family)
MTARNVLITGAGSGLGRALAIRYAAVGCAVGCADLNRENAEATLAMLAGDGHRVFEVDVGSDEIFERFVQEVHESWGAPQVVINNAGIASGGNLLEAGISEWRELLEINLLGVVRGCRAFLPGMVQARRGQIINTASFAALAGAPHIMTYGVSKAAVYTLSEQLRAELDGSGVSVSVLCPAFFQTNLLQSWRGSERMRHAAGKLMQHSGDTLDAVADATFAAAERGDFLILPTRNEPMRWRMKRWFPNLYFRQLLKLARSRGQSVRDAGA